MCVFFVKNELVMLDFVCCWSGLVSRMGVCDVLGLYFVKEVAQLLSFRWFLHAATAGREERRSCLDSWMVILASVGRDNSSISSLFPK